MNNDRIQALLDRAKEDGLEQNLKPVLENAMTVGDLMSILKQFDPETPIELEIPVEIKGEEVLSEYAFLTLAYDNADAGPNSEVLVLQGAKPELFETLQAWEEENDQEELM